MVNTPDAAVGASVRCPQCGSYFTAVPPEEVGLPCGSFIGGDSGGRKSRSTRALRADECSGVAIGYTTLTSPTSLHVPSSPALEDCGPLLPIKTSATDAVGLSALLLSWAAIFCASFPQVCSWVLPLSGIGLLAGLAGLLRNLVLNTKQWVLAASGSALAALVFLMALLWPGLFGPAYQLSRQKDSRDANAIRVVPLAGSPFKGQDADGVDAAQAALQQGGTRVQITKVWIEDGKIQGAAARKGRLLLVRVQVHRVEEASKFAARKLELPPSRSQSVQARLIDAAGKSYEALDLAEAGGLENIRKSSRFPVALHEEVLVFPAPPPGQAHLRLEIAATAWGGTEPFRFTIPATMIRGTPSGGTSSAPKSLAGKR
jgi:hypothetical protein